MSIDTDHQVPSSHDDSDPATQPVVVTHETPHSNRRRNLLIGGGAVAALGGILTAVVVGHSSDKEAPSIGNYGTGSQGKQTELTLDAATPSQFDNDDNFTDPERQQWAIEQLQAPSQDPEYPNMTVEEAARQRLDANLANEKRLPLEQLTGASLVEPALTNSASETNIRRAVTLAAATYAKDLPTAKKILAATYDNSVLSAPNSHIVKTLENSFMMSRDERLKQDVEITFTPADASVLEATGQVVEAVSPISQSSPPSRISLQHDTVDKNGRPDFEIKESFVNNRWIVTKADVTSLDDAWIAPSRIRSTHLQ